MGGAAWQHFRALSYKNSLLKWRRPFTSCAELILPVIFIGLLVSIKESLEPEDVPALFSDEGTFRSGPYKYPSPDVQTLTDLYAFYGPVPDGAIGEEEDFCGFLSSNFVGGLPEQYEGLLFRCDDGDDGCSCQRKQIAIAPGNADDAALNTIVDDFIAAQPSTHTIDSTMSMMRRFEDEKAAIDYVRQSDYSDDPEITPLGAIIVVNGAAPDYDFVIRTNMTNGDFERILPPTEWSTSALVRSRDSDTGLAGTYLETYLENGFLLLQNTVFEFALAQEADEAGSTKPKVARTYTEFPSDDYTQDDFWSNIGAAGNLFGVFLAVALVYPFATVVRMLVSEKEAKIREGMKMMALSDTAFWSSWMILFFVINFIQTILIYVVGASLFEYSDGGLIFALFLFFLMASTALAFALAACFSRSMTAAILSSVFYITGYALYEGVWMNTVSTGAKLAACLHPVTCFTLATVPLAEYEEGGVGITSDTINSSEQNNFTFGDALGMLIADIFIWYFVAWYLDQVTPTEWGVPRKPWFLFTADYWREVCGCCCKVDTMAVTDNYESVSTSAKENHYVESVPHEMTQDLANGHGVVVRSLRKVFHTNAGKKVAVNDLSLEMYEGEITSLLGHNGAGKTSTMNMLTGMLPPTSGTALMNGKDIRYEMAAIRQELGACPQHDILFPDLTVYEHLKLYSTFKGVPSKEREEEVERMITMVGLTEKRNNRSKELSGGMKRKLSVGIAFIGNSKIILLDEPTSGMDPYSRRFTWNVIRNNKEGKTIVLTTHFMDEADLLGDRIAIMGEGELKCHGSSLFLKQLFGVGYQLTIEKGAGFQELDVIDAVHDAVPRATELSNVGTELSYQMPFSASNKFSALFRHFDAHKEEWAIESYGISVTTLEEVFLKVARHENPESLQHKSSRLLDAAEKAKKRMKALAVESKVDEMREEAKVYGEDGGDVELVGGGHDLEADEDGPKEIRTHDRSNEILFFGLHLKALLIKRALVFKRDYKPWICQYMIPLIFVLAGVGGISSIDSTVNEPLLILNTDDYNGGGASANPMMYNDPGTEWGTNFYSGTYPNPGEGTFFYDPQAELCEDFGYTGGATCPLSATTTPTTHEAVMDEIDGEEVAAYADFNGNSVTDPLLGFQQQLLENEDVSSDGDSQYGAIAFAVANAVSDISSVATDIPTYLYIVMSNYTALHGAPIFDAIAQEGILKTIDSDASFTVSVHPLPETKKQKAVNDQANTFGSLMILLLAIPFIPAGFVIFPVREVMTKSKHQQVVSGVSYEAYWLSHWIFDVLSYQPTWLVIFGLLAAFDLDNITKGEAGNAVMLLFFLYGFAITGFTYITSYAFDKPATAQVVTLMINFIIGVLMTLAAWILEIIEDTRDANEVIQFVFRLFPTFCLGRGILWIGLQNIFEIIGIIPVDSSPFSKDVAQYDIIFLAWESVVYVTIAILMDRAMTFPWLRQLVFGSRMTDEEAAKLDEAEIEDDVVAENERVASGGADNELIAIRGIRHKYAGGKFAVRGVSLGIPTGQCFGLLGINGAGKTTTLSILSGEFAPSRGTATLDGHDLLTDPIGVRRLIGYCPQFDALFEHLTGQEHLAMYARIKGVYESEIEKVCTDKATEMDLLKHWERTAGRYSGGNKRKLSVACAMIGEPKIVFLDEPSTGMDPLARRFMWDVISAIATRRGRCAVILTTHSMEECEALCGRIGIMVGGRFRCIGSAQHLKHKYGLGFSLEAALKLPTHDEGRELASRMGVFEEDTINERSALEAALTAVGYEAFSKSISEEGSGGALHYQLSHGAGIPTLELAEYLLLEKNKMELEKALHDSYEGVVLREAQGKKMSFELPGEDAEGTKLQLADVFDVLEGLKESCGVQEYSLMSTSLEMVFNRFAAQQEEEKGHAAGLQG